MLHYANPLLMNYRDAFLHSQIDQKQVESFYEKEGIRWYGSASAERLTVP